jgi:hypothetical protein
MVILKKICNGSKKDLPKEEITIQMIHKGNETERRVYCWNLCDYGICKDGEKCINFLNFHRLSYF